MMPIHDLGDALAIGISAFLESILTVRGQFPYLGYKRLVSGVPTAVILITG